MKVANYLASGICLFLTLTDLESWMRILLLTLGVISGIFSLFVSIIKWYKSAKEDGSIDLSEIEDLVNTIQDEITEVITNVKDNN